jgi:hypothetical protein
MHMTAFKAHTKKDNGAEIKRIEVLVIFVFPKIT